MSFSPRSFVSGESVPATGAVFHAFNPVSGMPLEPEFRSATPGDVGRAAEAAHAAFPVLSRRSAGDRALLLEAIAHEIESLGDSLLERCGLETALPRARLAGERARTCAQLRLFAELVREGSWVDARIDTALADRQPLPRPDIRRSLQPLGPVAVFGASNFPLAFSVAGGDTASALAAGCPVIVKGHPAHPGTSDLVAAAVARAVRATGMPPGVFGFVPGGVDVGLALVSHPLVSAVGFTGSHAGGRALLDAASRRPVPIPVFAEMSSINPLFVLPGAIAQRCDALASGLAGSVTLGCGQFCTKPGVIFVLKGPETDAFVLKVAGAIETTAPAHLLTPSIRSGFIAASTALCAVPGVRTLSLPLSEGEVAVRAGLASVDVGTFRNDPRLRHEVFGPFTLVVLCDTVEEMVAAAEALDGQLTASVHASIDEWGAMRPLLDTLERRAGRVILNGFPTGVEVSPAMNHGGPYPATTDTRFTSVGTGAILRFARPVCLQGYPDVMLPAELQNANPRGIMRLVNGVLTRDPIA